MEANDHQKVDNLDVTATKTVHGDPKAVGFKIKHDNFIFSYTADTEYFPELHKHHRVLMC